MAVTKIWAIHDSVSRVVDYSTNPSKTKLSDLEQVLLYAADKGKTLDEGEQQYAVTGIGCRAESAAREMAAVQRRFGKAGGNVAYHAYQSFKTGEVTAEECHRIGVETARRLRGMAPADFPAQTAVGALGLYISNQSVTAFQPMNVNFGIMPPLDHRVKGKRNKNAELARRSLAVIEAMREEVLR